ncbi:hypothetical protein Tco_0653848 [Tanacetum coccineum]|uniref:RNA-directed DNA polymerase, eukaryota, Reverse transcriptase zinc-binding domain protein n=1 Tax=Tanacetum coccineum TaxID=301880 RepID=A0ABQ4X1Q3_9ASTR
MNTSNTDLKVAAWNVRGMCTRETQKEVKRIIMGWNSEVVNIMVLHCSDKTMLRWVESIQTHKKFFCCFTYAANHEDHSAGGSCKTADMMEFKECIEEIEVQDLNCLGLHYTWIQSRLNPGNGKKAFKFANFTADKPEFLDVVRKGWELEVKGCFTKWKGELQNIQARVDASPHDADIKREEARIMKEYSASVQDEESFLCQQAKIEWLKDGDKNSKFFHANLKARNHKSGVAAIRNEKGVLFEDEKVPDIFV